MRSCARPQKSARLAADASRLAYRASHRRPPDVMSGAPGSTARELPRILHLLAPGSFGGLESVVTALASGWGARGGRVGVALALEVGHPVPDEWSALEAGGVQVLQLPVPHRAYRREWRLYSEAMRTFSPDLVHCHGYRPDLLAGWAARGLGLPRVSTVHGFTGGGWKNRMYERLQIRALAGFDGVIAVSRPIRDRLTRAGVSGERITVLPNALSPVPFLPRSTARARLGCTETGPLVGWVGRLSSEKGLDVLIDALACLTDVPVAVSVLGDGPLRGAAEAQANRLGVADRIRWHGVVRSAGQYFRGFDVFVLSSRTEGTPIVLLEAMAAEVPVVATKVGGVPDVVGPDEAALVAPEEPLALAMAIRQILADPAQARLRAERARARVERDFTVSTWIEQHIRLYRTILERRERGLR